MGLFQWLGKLLDDLLAWLGRAFQSFLEGLVWALQKIWNTLVAATLIAAFGFDAILFVIFYSGAVLGETFMEVWDPLYYDSKSSEVFILKQAPQGSPLATSRSEAKVLTLENWS